jgi:hypothetical protein
MFDYNTTKPTLLTLVIPPYDDIEDYLTDTIIAWFDRIKQRYHSQQDATMERFCNRLIATITYLPETIKTSGFKLYAGMLDDGTWVQHLEPSNSDNHYIIKLGTHFATHNNNISL